MCIRDRGGAHENYKVTWPEIINFLYGFERVMACVSEFEYDDRPVLRLSPSLTHQMKALYAEVRDTYLGWGNYLSKRKLQLPNLNWIMAFSLLQWYKLAEIYVRKGLPSVAYQVADWFPESSVVIQLQVAELFRELVHDPDYFCPCARCLRDASERAARLPTVVRENTTVRDWVPLPIPPKLAEAIRAYLATRNLPPIPRVTIPVIPPEGSPEATPRETRAQKRAREAKKMEAKREESPHESEEASSSSLVPRMCQE